MLHPVLEAAGLPARNGIECNVFGAYMYPLDPAPIPETAGEQGGPVLIVEDGYHGGLHSEFAEAAAECGDVRVVGMTARRIPKFAKTAAEVFTHPGVGLQRIISRVTSLARR